MRRIIVTTFASWQAGRRRRYLESLAALSHKRAR